VPKSIDCTIIVKIVTLATGMLRAYHDVCFAMKQICLLEQRLSSNLSMNLRVPGPFSTFSASQAEPEDLRSVDYLEKWPKMQFSSD
jgi:hypothetical protein